MDFTTVLLLIGFIIVAVYFTIKMRQVRKLQQQAREKYAADLKKYKTLTSEQFDTISVSELTNAVLFHIMGKEDSLYEGETISDEDVYDLLSDGERMIYAIYQVEISLRSGRSGSLHSFFIEDRYAKYRSYAQQAFRDIGCADIADLIKAAARLAQIIEEDLDDEENDIEEKYASYNFADYTKTLTAMMKTSGVVKKAGKYIKNHKSMFIDQP